MPEKIVFMINSLTGGGAERIMARLVSGSAPWAGRYDIHVILLDEEKAAYELPEWVTVHRLDTGFSMAKGLVRGVKLLRHLKPAVCLSFLSRSNFINVVAARFTGHRAVISERVNASSHHPRTRSGRIALLLTRLLYPRANRIICPSAGIGADLVENFSVPDSRNVVIPNPVDTLAIRKMSEAEMIAPTQRPYIVAVGRLVPNKNFSMLLDAFSKSGVDLDLVILGEGPLREALEQQRRALGLERRVHLPGFASNPFPVVRHASIYALPSSAEGFPNGLAEAITLGVPAISTNCLSGPSEILDGRDHLDINGVYHGRYGLLVPVDDAGAMAEALELMTDDGMRADYAARALEGAARYQLEPAIRAYWNVLEEKPDARH